MNLDDIKKKLNELETDPNLSEEDLSRVEGDLRRVRKMLQKLEHRLTLLMKEWVRKKPYARLAEWTEYRLTHLAEELRQQGMSVRKTQALSKAIESQAYRLMELVRSGRREEAFYLLLRTYLVHGHSFPRSLQEAFLPIYTPDETKLLVFSFLSGFLSKVEKETS